MELAGVTDPRRAVIFGDSVTADIGAARNAGVDCILYTNGIDVPAWPGANHVAKSFEDALELILN
jgi:phosphoglycolate phosphatase-like HAD superfamily hydrolase